MKKVLMLIMAMMFAVVLTACDEDFMRIASQAFIEVKETINLVPSDGQLSDYEQDKSKTAYFNKINFKLNEEKYRNAKITGFIFTIIIEKQIFEKPIGENTITLEWKSDGLEENIKIHTYSIPETAEEQEAQEVSFEVSKEILLLTNGELIVKYESLVGLKWGIKNLYIIADNQ